LKTPELGEADYDPVDEGSSLIAVLMPQEEGAEETLEGSPDEVAQSVDENVNMTSKTAMVFSLFLAGSPSSALNGPSELRPFSIQHTHIEETPGSGVSQSSSMSHQFENLDG